MARNALSRAARCWLRRPVPPPGSRGLQAGVSRALFLLDVILSTRVSKCPPLPLVDSESSFPKPLPACFTFPVSPGVLARQSAALLAVWRASRADETRGRPGPPSAQRRMSSFPSQSTNARPRGYPTATLHLHGLARTARHVLSYLPYTHLPYSSRADRKKAHPAPSFTTPRPQKCTSAGLPCRDLPGRLLPSLLPHASHARARICSPTLQESRRRTPQPPTPYPRVSRLPCSAYLAVSCPPTLRSPRPTHACPRGPRLPYRRSGAQPRAALQPAVAYPTAYTTTATTGNHSSTPPRPARSATMSDSADLPYTRPRPATRDRVRSTSVLPPRPQQPLL